MVATRTATNPYVFVVGCPRSGTTLLQRILDAHPDLAVIHETLWVPRLYERREGLTDDDRVTTRLVDELCRHRRFPRLDLDRLQLEELAEGGPTYAEFVSSVFDLVGRRHGKPLVGDKTPGYVRSIPTLHALWPDARFIHLVRDGRDVCGSLLDWKKADRVAGEFSTWTEDRVTTAALWWERNVRLGREAAARLGRRYHEVRFEALVERPERECRRLCRFLALPYSDEMLRFHEGRTRDGPGLSSKRRWLPPTTGIRDWRRDLSPADVARFEAASGPLLDELGYHRAGPPALPAAARRAERLRGRFAEEVAARGRPTPEAWAA